MTNKNICIVFLGVVMTTPAPTRIFIMSCLCHTNNTFINMTQEEIIDQLVKDTAIATNSTALAKSKYISMTDPRESSRIMGLTGASVMGSVFGLIMLLDVVTLFRRQWMWDYKGINYAVKLHIFIHRVVSRRCLPKVHHTSMNSCFLIWYSTKISDKILYLVSNKKLKTSIFLPVVISFRYIVLLGPSLFRSGADPRNYDNTMQSNKTRCASILALMHCLVLENPDDALPLSRT